MTLNNFTENYIKRSELSYRKKLGQYFTPNSLVNETLKALPKKEGALILEPSAGTGQFIDGIQRHFKSPKIDCFEVDRRLASLLEENYKDVSVKETNSLLENPYEKYDYVIGNPPYFELKLDRELKKRYKDIISGRVNIYSLFIKLGLDFLKPGGYLAYVIPSSMNNGSYFKKLRNYIKDRAAIKNIIYFNSNDFDDASQQTMCFVLRKGGGGDKYFVSKENSCIISKNYLSLRKEINSAKSIRELGFRVSTGPITWNQNKEKLTDSSEIPLIWAKNIDENIILGNHNKKQYIKDVPWFSNKGIVVNRIVGTKSSFSIRSAIVDLPKWTAENHVNVIFPTSNAKITLEELHRHMKNPRAHKVMSKIIGNTQISKTELENWFPIWM